MLWEFARIRGKFVAGDHIRNCLKPLKGKKMGYDGKYLYIFFRDNSPVDPAKIIALYRKKIKELRFTPDYKLFIPAPVLTEKEILITGRFVIKDACPINTSRI